MDVQNMAYKKMSLLINTILVFSFSINQVYAELSFTNDTINSINLTDSSINSFNNIPPIFPDVNPTVTSINSIMLKEIIMAEFFFDFESIPQQLRSI